MQAAHGGADGSSTVRLPQRPMHACWQLHLQQAPQHHAMAKMLPRLLIIKDMYSHGTCDYLLDLWLCESWKEAGCVVHATRPGD